MTQSYITNAEWQYDGGHVSTSAIPVCCPATNFSLVYVNLNFTRLRPFYVINLIIPSMLLSVCMVLAFLLPTDCGERLGYSLTILLSYTVVLTITTDMMPTTSKQTPVISKLCVFHYVPNVVAIVFMTSIEDHVVRNLVSGSLLSCWISKLRAA